MHLLVTGGTGVVGRVAADHPLTRGHPVRLFGEGMRRMVEAAAYPGDMGG